MDEIDAWARRRVYIKFTSIWCASMVSAIVAFTMTTGRESSLLETMGIGLLTLLGSMIGSYVFGATWDDKNRRGAMSFGGRRVETRTEVVTPAEPTNAAAPIRDEGP